MLVEERLLAELRIVCGQLDRLRDEFEIGHGRRGAKEDIDYVAGRMGVPKLYELAPVLTAMLGPVFTSIPILFVNSKIFGY